MKLICFYIILFINLAHATEKLMPKESLNIYVIKNTNNQNIGDKNSSTGIAKSIKNKILANHHIDVNIYEFTASQKEELEKLTTIDNRSIIVTAGNYGIEFIENSSLGKNNFIIWSGHQYFKSLPNIAKKASVIILPQYIINDQINKNLGNKIIPVAGVANNIDQELLQNEYNKHPELKNIEKSIVVFIGGDAPDENGIIKKMSLDDAFYMGKIAATIAKNQNAFILIANSPRTTDSQLKEFEKSLIQEGLNSDQYKIFDFHLGARVYYSLLFEISSKNSDVLVSGESSSMVRDIIEQAKKPIYVYEPQSMNEAHHKQLDFEHKEGRIIYVHNEYSTANHYEYITPQSVTQLIGEEIYKIFISGDDQLIMTP